jgi:hypothetical protein
VEILASLTHPNIMPLPATLLFVVGDVHIIAGLIMPYYPVGSLRKFMIER